METERLEQIFRAEHGRILATLIRLLGDFDAAEEALQEAVATALEKWPDEGMPGNPASWLISTARHKAIDGMRRRAFLTRKQDEIARHMEQTAPASAAVTAPDADGSALASGVGGPGLEETDGSLAEDRLRLIFTCCHPALAPEAQVALTLRTLGGLSTEEIAHAFLVPTPTMAQRLVRAKGKIRAAGIPYALPADDALAERLQAVMAVVYLVFNEGYSASFGSSLVRNDLCEQAIRLGRMLVELLPEQPEPRGLLALMLLHDARRATRLDGCGDLVMLEDQDRAHWDRAQIEEGAALVEAALRSAGRGAGPYALQAAIAALHAEAPTAAATDWKEIAALYGVLAEVHPTPVVELNRAVA
ncbi:MAG TPA: sigma-70 family RNA polymerase sigma factor, partial [Methylomirabilota bacterium]|nr:sigma-70 family RNA polymerase sigma factor [Methylomirabilota bacterium]